MHISEHNQPKKNKVYSTTNFVIDIVRYMWYYVSLKAY